MGSRRLAPLWVLAVTALLLLSGIARAEPIALTPTLRGARAPAEVLEDPSHALTVADVSTGPASARFVPLARPNLGYQRAAFWVRFSVARAPDAPAGWVVMLSMTPSRAELYAPRADGALDVKVSGLALPFGTREIADPRVAFRIEPPPSRVTTYYLRLEFDDTAWIAPELYADADYATKLARENLARGLYYGAILALIAYNVLLFAVTRDRAAIMYVAFELTFMLSQGSMDKLTFQYLWPGSPLWARNAEPIFGYATMFGALGFARSFLSLPETAPRAARAFTWLMAGALVSGAFGAASALAPLRPIAERHAAAMLTTLGVYIITCSLLLLGTGVVLARRGVPNAKTYLAAWSLLVVGSFVQFSASLGLAQLLDGMAALKIGSLAEATLLSLGLAARVGTIRRERERASARLLEAREQRLAALGRLVAGFAHEIGNPLNFVLGGATEAAERLDAASAALGPGGRSTEEIGAARQALALVVDGSERMKRILDNLRCYVRARDVDPVATDVARAVSSTLALATPLIDRTGVKVTLEAAEVPPVEVRPGELEQVFTNLVVNACQAMAEGGGELSITISAEGTRVRVAFEDTGPGIPESDRDAVFEPFFTTREGGGGTGLGLYVSSDIVRRNGGDLRIEDGAVGTRFVVTFPAAPAA